MKEFEDDFREERKEYFNMQKTLLKYWRLKAVFIIAVCSCLLLALGYIYLATPSYKVSASITIHDEERGGSKNDNLSAEKIFDSGRDWLNTENEVEALKSSSLIEQVISNLGLNISYKEATQRHKSLLYKNYPIEVSMSKEDINNITEPICAEFKHESNNQVIMTVSTNVDDEKWEKDFKVTHLPAKVSTPCGKILLAGDFNAFAQQDYDITVEINNPTEYAQALAGDLTVSIVSRTSSVVKLEYVCPNKAMGLDFLKELIRCYNLRANDDKNRVAQRTADFLRDRVAEINEELKQTDEKLEKFKRTAGLTNMDFDTREYLQENSRYGKELMDIETQLSMLRYLKSFVDKKENKENLVPGDIGLRDVNLSKTIETHNQLVLDYQRLSRTSSPNNPVTMNLKNQIRGSFQSVVTSIENTYSGMLLSKAETERKARTYDAKIKDVPAYERMLTEMSRLQEKKSTVYLNLLQKMEETALMLEAVTESAKFIDMPYSEPKPALPNKTVIFIAAFVIGIFAAIVWIVMNDMFSRTILNADEVAERIGSAAIIGKIRRHKKGIPSGTDFGKLNARLQIAMDGMDGNIIGVFSNNDRDGKSYIATNLAKLMADGGKKVLLVNITRHGKQGVTSVTHPAESERLSVCEVSSIGHIALDELHSDYDYVLINSASLASSPEMLTLGKHIDRSLFVCRLGNSERAGLEDLETISRQRLLPNMSVVINNAF